MIHNLAVPALPHSEQSEAVANYFASYAMRLLDCSEWHGAIQSREGWTNGNPAESAGYAY